MDHDMGETMSALFAMRASKEVLPQNLVLNSKIEEMDPFLPSPSGASDGFNQNDAGGTEDRLQRSRERNRMHARKTRQRKKLQMQTLQLRANELKLEQQRLKQIINDRKTANILLDICSPPPGPPGPSNSQDNSSNSVSKSGAPPMSLQIPPDIKFDADVEKILRRPNADIPDGKRIMKETAALVPSHKAKTIRSMSMGEDVGDDFEAEADIDHQLSGPSTPSETAALTLNGKFPDDGIDYALLSRDRNKCTPAELDQIRRERNRMHAKRTRDRKKIFVEEMDNVIKVLDAENLKLRALIEQYYPQNTFSMSTQPGALPPPTEQFYIGQRNPGGGKSTTTSTGGGSGSRRKETAVGEKEKPTASTISKQPRPTHGKTTRRNTPVVIETTETSSSSVTSSSTSKSSVVKSTPNPAKRHKPNQQQLNSNSDSNSDSDTMTFNGSSDNGGSEYGATVSEQPDSSVTQSSKGSTKGSSNASSSNGSSSSSVASGDEEEGRR